MTAGDAKFSDAMSCNVVFCRSTSRSIMENNASSRVVGQGMGLPPSVWGVSGRGLSEQGVDLGNAGLVSAAGEGGIDECIERFSRDLVTDQPLTEAHHICIVVLASEMGRSHVVNRG